MVLLLYEYNLVLYFTVPNHTSKKGGNAPRATDEKRFLSSASLILKGSIVLLSQYKVLTMVPICLNITQGCQHPTNVMTTNVMTYTTAAKTDKPTDWKASWISFGDEPLQ
jgi:hypothetical protein